MEVDGAVGGLHYGRSPFRRFSLLTTLHTLASGSSGNAALLSRNGTYVLLDAGISCRRITAALRTLELTPEDLSAVFITHTHSDHICGMQTLMNRWDLPVCASEETCRQLEYRIAGVAPRLRPFRWGETLRLGAFTVTPFPTSHDAPGSAGYRFDEAGVLTDSGRVTEEARTALAGAELLLLESNHDVDRLRSGPYPYYLKQRILSDRGHLSNDDAARFAVEEAAGGARQIVLAHLSAENNTPELAREAVASALADAGLAPRLTVAPRSELSGAYRTEECPCSASR
jgi:phosphoribosyl 1,2-cyclic phosphodiesterase